MGKVAKYMVEQTQESERMLRDMKHSETIGKGNSINKYSPRKLFAGICDDSINNTDLKHLYKTNFQDSWSAVWSLIKVDNNFPEGCEKLLKIIIDKAPHFIELKENVFSVQSIQRHYGSRLRNIEDWNVKTKNPHRAYVSLMKHLFCKYDAPEFLLNRDGGPYLGISLFIHIGQGNSMKNYTLPLTNLVITKKVYPLLYDTPADYTYYEGFRRAQILSLGGNEQLFKKIMASTNFPKGNDDTFWITVIQFFIESVMFDYDKIPEIVDYIVAKRRERATFSMKARNIASLLSQSEKWHAAEAFRTRALHRNNVGLLGYRYTPKVLLPNWKGANIGDYFYSVKRKEIFYDYKIVQIKSHQKLIDEGKAMRHCVGSYATSCSNGSTAIFSLRENEGSLVTIEVKQFEIVQTKGPCNRKPTGQEMHHIKEWAKKENLSFSKFIKF